MELPQLMHERLQWARIAGCVAVAGACLGMVGDYWLLYAPGGGYLEGDYAFMEGISNTRLLWGHYLGILAIPLEAAGLYLVWLGLLPRGRKVAFAAVCAGMYLMFIGVAYHATLFPFGDAARWRGEAADVIGGALRPGHLEGAGRQAARAVMTWRPFNEPLGMGFAWAFFVSAGVFTVGILRGGTAWPRWVAAFSPVVVYAVVLGLYFLVPPVGNVLAPMGFNLGMAVFYGVLVWTVREWAPSA
jgi:hypothetical protein